MIVKKFSEGNMKSAAQQASDDKDKVNRTNKPNDYHLRGSFDFSGGSGCGIENPCVFGVHKSKL